MIRAIFTGRGFVLRHFIKFIPYTTAEASHRPTILSAGKTCFTEGHFGCAATTGIRLWRRYPRLPLTSELEASSRGMRTGFSQARNAILVGRGFNSRRYERHLGGEEQDQNKKSTRLGALLPQVFACGEDTHGLRLASELADLRTGYANWILAGEKRSSARSTGPKQQSTRLGAFLFWSCYPDSNWGPHPYQGCALPTEP